MEVLLDDAPVSATPGAAQTVLLDGEGARLVVRLGADEELAVATLSLSPAAGDQEPSFASAPSFATDQGDSLANIQWISVDWGSARTLESIAPSFTSGAAALGVRVRIARGASQWYTPPGPTGAAVPDTETTVALSFPNAVADRVMLEFVETGAESVLTNTFTSVSLTGNPVLDFGREAKDFEVAVEPKRAFFTHAGLPAATVELPKLLETLREQLELEVLSEVEIALSVGAGVAGFVGLQWAFVRDRIAREFADGEIGQTLALDFGGSAELPLFERPDDDAPLAQLRSLELNFGFEPVRERLVLDPAPDQLREGLGELVEPLFDAAQRLNLPTADASELVGVALRTRALSPTAAGRVELIADLDGAPAGESLARGSFSLDNPEGTRAVPRWLSVDFEAPVVLEGPAWLVAHLDSGQLVWLLGEPRDPERVGPPHYRRNDTGTGGAWLSREARNPTSWGLTRVRALEAGPLTPPALTLVLVAHDGVETLIPLTPDASGQLRWRPEDPDAVSAASAIHLRVSSEVAATVTLTDPTLTWRELPPPADTDVVVDDALPDVVVPDVLIPNVLTPGS